MLPGATQAVRKICRESRKDGGRGERTTESEREVSGGEGEFERKKAHTRGGSPVPLVSRDVSLNLS